MNPAAYACVHGTLVATWLRANQQRWLSALPETHLTLVPDVSCGHMIDVDQENARLQL